MIELQMLRLSRYIFYISLLFSREDFLFCPRNNSLFVYHNPYPEFIYCSQYVTLTSYKAAF
jgi:hypothetical protein